LGSVEMEWQQYAGRRVRGICRVRLLECRTLVGESTDAAVASEIMVEGTIFLDEDHHVLNVSHFGANGWSGNGGSIATAASRQKRGSAICCRRSGANGQYFSPGNIPGQQGEPSPPPYTALHRRT